MRTSLLTLILLLLTGIGRTQSSVSLELLAEGFTNPLSMTQTPDGHLLVVDQIGLIQVIDQRGEVLPTPFLDLRDRLVELKEKHDERGLLGVALHPDYASNGRFFVHYSVPLRAEAPDGFSHTKRLSEFRRSEQNALRADADSERILMLIDQPQTNHNGGTLTFGPDGYLYLGLGDGGGANDKGVGHRSDWYARNEGGNGQNLYSNLLGGIIRIDINNGDPYAIPSGNFLSNQPSSRELYATGLRNPYRFSFDRGGNNDLFVGDLGQKLWEEINIVRSGGNYGWNVREGFTCFNADKATQPLDDCPRETPEGFPLVDPILVFPHKDTLDYVPYGIAVIGGHVYRGSDLSVPNGNYLFGTWTQHHGTPSGAMYVAREEAGGWTVEDLSIANAEGGTLGRYLTGFAEDNAGELYLLTSENEAPIGKTGKIYRLVSTTDYSYTASDKSGQKHGDMAPHHERDKSGNHGDGDGHQHEHR
jgi:glucose/arabinose dehydrogenase